MPRTRTVKVDFKADTTDLLSGMSGVSGGMGKLGGAAAGLAAGLAAAGVAAGVKFVGASVSAFGDFDQAMTNSLAIMGDVSDSMRGEMSDAAREVAKTTTFSASEAAEAFFFLASAGLEAEEQLAALPKVAEFAQAGNFDLALATDLLTDAQSALGLVVKGDVNRNLAEMVRLSDVLVGANALANSSVQEFSEALTSKAGSALKIVNKSVEEGVAVLAVFADAGLKGATAGETLARVLDFLPQRLAENEEAFATAGIEIFDASGQMHNFADIIEDFENSLEGKSVEERLKFFGELGIQKRLKSAISLLLGSSDALRDYEDNLKSAGDVTQDVAEKQLGTFNAQITLMKSQLHDVFIEIGSTLGPQLLDVFEDLVPVLRDDLLPALGELIIIIMEIVKVAAPAMAWSMGTLTTALKTFVDTSADFDRAMLEVKESLDRPAEVAGVLLEGLIRLADKGELTKESFEALAAASGLTERELHDVREMLLAVIQVNPTTESSLDDVTAAMSGLDDGANAADEAMRLLFEQHANVQLGAENLTEALIDAKESHDSLAKTMLEAVNPTLNAISAYEDYKEALDVYNDVAADSESSTDDIAQAQIDLLRETLEAQGALDAFSGANLDEQLDIISRALGISKTEAQELLETLGLIDGTEVTTVINIVERRQGSEKDYSQDPRYNSGLRQRRERDMMARDLGLEVGGAVAPRPISAPRGDPLYNRSDSRSGKSQPEINLTVNGASMTAADVAEELGWMLRSS